MTKKTDNPNYWLNKIDTEKIDFVSFNEVTPTDQTNALEARLAELEMAQLLLNLRKMAGLTQQELADRLNQSRVSISQTENRPLSAISIGTFTRLAHACGYTFDPTKALKPINT